MSYFLWAACSSPLSHPLSVLLTGALLWLKRHCKTHPALHLVLLIEQCSNLWLAFPFLLHLSLQPFPVQIHRVGNHNPSDRSRMAIPGWPGAWMPQQLMLTGKGEAVTLVAVLVILWMVMSGELPCLVCTTIVVKNSQGMPPTTAQRRFGWIDVWADYQCTGGCNAMH